MGYTESVDKGVTTYAAQIAGRWAKVIPNHAGAAQPGFVQAQTTPTLAFIANQIKFKEDTEILLQNDDAFHYLTLTGISYNDATNKGSFSFIDPLGGKPGMAMILGLGGDDFIQTNYQLAGGNSEIVGVVAESPIPEPSAALVLLAGISGLMGIRRWSGARKHSAVATGRLRPTGPAAAP
jgi:hypothetical protein